MNGKKKIKEIIKQGHMKADNMMKAGEAIVNSRIAVEAWKRGNKQIKEAEEEKERMKKIGCLNEQEVVICHYDEKKLDGKVLDKNKKPK